MDFEPVIGLEIHAQLLTQTKIFCGCSAEFGAPPNTHVCPVCLGLPGTLPVLNRQAVDYAIRAAMAVDCIIQPISVFARKNYFYPDLPKGYQITQYERPLATDGRLGYDLKGKSQSVGIIRVHLEEDAGRSFHEGFSDSSKASYIDFNRSGVPLIEIVTHPDLRVASDAAEFFGRLRAILLAVKVNDGNMEEGSLRCDANISVRPVGVSELGVKVEVKNINSFRFLQRALEYEFERQVDVLRSGGRVRQETRLWNTGTSRTISMRSKEEAHDYRYFPEPDLRPLEVSRAWIKAVSETLPELPDHRKRRLIAGYQLPEQNAELLIKSSELSDYFEATALAAGNPKSACNWIMGELMRSIKISGLQIDRSPIQPEALADLIKMVDAGKITGSAAKRVFERMYETGQSAETVVKAENLAQINDSEILAAIVQTTIEAHRVPVASYRAGKVGVMGFLVGQVMRATRGQANPKLVNELMRRALKSPESDD